MYRIEFGHPQTPIAEVPQPVDGGVDRAVGWNEIICRVGKRRMATKPVIRAIL